MIVLAYLSTREAKGCTTRDVPITSSSSHFLVSYSESVGIGIQATAESAVLLTCTAHFANLSGSASPKNTMSMREREKSEVQY